MPALDIPLTDCFCIVVVVCLQLVGERNYHAFYQLLAAQDDYLPGAAQAARPYDQEQEQEQGQYSSTPPILTRAELGLTGVGSINDASKFTFLSGSTCYEAEGIDDNEWFAEMIETMNVIGITILEQQHMVKVIAAVIQVRISIAGMYCQRSILSLKVIAAVVQVGQITFESAMGADGNDKAIVTGTTCITR